MKYQVKKVVEDIDLLELNTLEYDKINTTWHEIMIAKYPELAKTNQIPNLDRMILAAKHFRAEVLLSVDGIPPE